MSRTLHPEDRISHYRILGLLGKGGMGEVYLALDESLERNVALKILPPRLVRSEERLRRFVQEAKAASSLNHPSIVTIYEIGRDSVMRGGSGRRGRGEPEAAIGSDSPERSHAGAPASADVHYISMEVVSGETLASKIHAEKVDVRTLLGWLAQAAEGIAKAHAAGIVHRDLKPGNIMVSKDGFAKVLDFGLAKLTEKQAIPGEDLSNVSTEPRTKEGSILGTLGYMSPEQVQGKPVDHRSDIFSMGCILYEVATRRRPFAADTDVEVVHKILRERPSPIERLNPEVPAEVRRVVRRCLAKNPDQRQQSMKDLAMELREIVEEYDSLSPSGSGGTLSSGALGALPGRRKRLLAGVAAAAIVGVAGIGVGLYGVFVGLGGDATQPRALGDMRISVLLSHEDLDRATLSRDGRYVAYSTTAAGSNALHVRQIRTGSEVEILPHQETPIMGVSFSPDGDYLYYLNQDPESPLYSALFQVPSMGGSPRKIAFDVDTPVTFSSDGTLMAFKRGLPDQQADSIVVATTGTGKASELIRIQAPESFSSAPAWSPDGQHIAATIHSFQGGSRTRLVLVDPDSGTAERLGQKTWLSVDSLAWLPDGRGLIVSASEIGTQGAQLYRVSFPGGDARRMTNDLNGYVGVTLSSDGVSIAALRTSSVANLWVAPVAGGGEAQPVTFASSNADSILLFEPLSEGEIAFTAMKESGIYLWAIKPDGSERRQVTSQGIFVRWADFAPEAGILFTQVEEAGIAHVWRVDPDGSDARQLTSGDGEGLHSVAPNGSLALYGRADRPAELWSLTLPAGESQMIATSLEGDPQFSPDGSRLLFPVLDEIEGKVYPRCVIVPAEGGKPVASLLLPPRAGDLEWAPGGTALSFIDASRGWNVFRIPIEGGEPVAITALTEGRILDHEWSPDGRRLSAVREVEGRSGLWIQEAGNGEPIPLAEFKAGEISGHDWSRDSASVIFRYGTSSRDVVMIRDFQ